MMGITYDYGSKYTPSKTGSIWEWVNMMIVIPMFIESLVLGKFMMIFS